MGDSLVGPLKRGRYVHAVHDRDAGAWIFTNLMNRAVIKTSYAEHSAVYDLLDMPNRLPIGEYELAVRQILLQKGFILPVECDELAVLRSKYWVNKRSPLVTSVAIVTTLQCNLRCEYCYQDHVQQEFSEEDKHATMNFLKKAAASLVSNHSCKTPRQFSLSWWGGEPLLQASTIKEIAAEAVPVFEQYGIKFSSYTSTNAVLLNRKNCKLLRDARLSRIQITIDGPRAIHDCQRPRLGGGATYDAVLRGLKNICDELPDAGRFVTLRVNVTPRFSTVTAEWEEFFSDLEQFKERISLNIHNAIANDFFTEAEANESETFTALMYSIREAARKRNFWVLDEAVSSRPGALYCGAIPDTNWIILPGRRLTKCTEKFHDVSKDCGRLELDGSVTMNNASEEWFNYSPFDSALCNSCDVLPICMGGCRMIPFDSNTGDRCARKHTLEKGLLQRLSATQPD